MTDDTPETPIDPPHYRRHLSGVECIEITESMTFCLGNEVKYVWRADLKGNALEDLLKARWYLTRQIDMLEAERGEDPDARRQ